MNSETRSAEREPIVADLQQIQGSHSFNSTPRELVDRPELATAVETRRKDRVKIANRVRVNRSERQGECQTSEGKARATVLTAAGIVTFAG
jgi:hypothetical protein